MAATAVSASLKATTLVQTPLAGKALKAAPVSQAFGLKASSSKVSASLEEVKGFVQKAADAGKAAALALASSALLASVRKTKQLHPLVQLSEFRTMNQHIGLY